MRKHPCVSLIGVWSWWTDRIRSKTGRIVCSPTTNFARPTSVARWARWQAVERQIVETAGGKEMKLTTLKYSIAMAAALAMSAMVLPATPRVNELTYDVLSTLTDDNASLG